MAVAIRLQRKGRTHRPFYHIVATDRKAPRDGKFIEKLGTYNPNSEPSEIVYNEERLKHWYAHGAQVSPSLKKILQRKKFPFERKLTHK